MDHLTLPRTGASGEIATFGPVHLEVTHLERAIDFWCETAGLRLRKRNGAAELGTAGETLVVLHPGAKRPALRGFSGLYHIAIHVPDQAEFSRMLRRLIASRTPISPVDHVMSKAIYLNDPDGLGIEFTLETPERFGGYGTFETDFTVFDAEGRPCSGRSPLDVRHELAQAKGPPLSAPLADAARIGHLHLHVPRIEAARTFYTRLGFLPGAFAPQLGFADLGAGGAYTHRIALNVWQGIDAPPAPAGVARLRGFSIRFDTRARLDAALRGCDEVIVRGDQYVLRDPAGTALMLTAEA
ncbi:MULTISPECIES: VOC family protein [unclassified Bradyrhizobium]|uniref:VOC family protein n=1 Tax=unclassified Bradyrhizobium TaxID=2631580 RepID=UPI0028E81FA1|nr:MULTISPECIES: VOC family protein [unclassified Bradyrhizobium]